MSDLQVDPAAARMANEMLTEVLRQYSADGHPPAALAFAMLMNGALLATQVFGPTGAALMLRKAAYLAEKQLRS